MELNSLDLHSAKLYINIVSNSTPGEPLLNYALTISELPLFSFTHLSTSPLCAVLSLRRRPAKPDSQAAYQAFCQPGCLIVLSKHPPAFCLPPPPQKPPRAATLCPPPFLSFLSYLCGSQAFGFLVLSMVLGFYFLLLLTAFLTSLLTHWAKEIHGSFPFQATDGFRKCLTSPWPTEKNGCIHLEPCLSHIFHFTSKAHRSKRSGGWR